MPQPKPLPPYMRVAAGAGQEAQPAAGVAAANALECSATVVEVAISSSIGIIHSSHTHGNSSGGAVRSSNIGSRIFGTARLDNRLNSSVEVERPITSSSNNIEEEIEQKTGHICTSREGVIPCGEEGHFFTEYRATMIPARNTPALTAPPRPYSAPSPGAHMLYNRAPALLPQRHCRTIIAMDDRPL